MRIPFVAGAMLVAGHMGALFSGIFQCNPIGTVSPSIIRTAVETSVGVIRINLVTMFPLFHKYILRESQRLDPTPRETTDG
ncbi:uncharacterized protein N7459_001407 [Penicillium hispanicum]|uniref:uncharacterized protein n=1 Tax=Penicillium hispanicum TaxID=1080232 RepID=UPI00254097C9|nr:uncharacterized protein N7459_001407 [Penicillium hispanicum]KAJ5595199.1 hypothetical protein N7459_001407 [Penicillium hispanicum]